MIKDVSDYFAAGGTRESLLELLAAVPEYTPPSSSKLPSSSTGLSSTGSSTSSLNRDTPFRPNGTGVSVNGSDGLACEDKLQTGLPNILVGNRFLRELTRESIDALVSRNNPPSLFAQEGRIVDVFVDERKRPVIRALNEHILRGVCDRAADYWVVTEGGWKRVFPPIEMIRDILSRNPREWRFPPLERIDRTPTFRPDYSLITAAGYDPATKTFYMPGPGLEGLRIPAKPTRDDCVRAKAKIHDVIAQFPFADKASYAHVFAGMFTVLFRNLIPGPVPLLVFTAPGFGTGKTLLADGVVARITTGGQAALYSISRDGQEQRKQITTMLLQGTSIIMWDNVTHLDSAEMALLLTSRTWADRLLGTNRSVELPVRCTFFATGNNVRIGGDLPRRVYKCRLDARVALPFKRRNFRYKMLAEHVEAQRAELLEALLTMGVGWIEAGRPEPKDLSAFGGYEAWTRISGSLLAWNELPDFLANSDDLHKEDTERQDWYAFLCALKNVFGDAEPQFTTNEVVKRIMANNEELRGALPGALKQKVNDAGGLAYKLGHAFSDHVDERFGDEQMVHLIKAGRGHGGAQLWQVLTDDTSVYDVSTMNIMTNPAVPDPVSNVVDVPNKFTILVAEVGDLVQWESNGVLAFPSPRPIKSFSADRKYAFFEGSTTGVPVEELIPAEDDGQGEYR
jgi:hypothetical protein